MIRTSLGFIPADETEEAADQDAKKDRWVVMRNTLGFIAAAKKTVEDEESEEGHLERVRQSLGLIAVEETRDAANEDQKAKDEHLIQKPAVILSKRRLKPAVIPSKWRLPESWVFDLPIPEDYTKEVALAKLRERRSDFRKLARETLEQNALAGAKLVTWPLQRSWQKEDPSEKQREVVSRLRKRDEQRRAKFGKK